MPAIIWLGFKLVPEELKNKAAAIFRKKRPFILGRDNRLA